MSIIEYTSTTFTFTDIIGMLQKVVFSIQLHMRLLDINSTPPSFAFQPMSIDTFGHSAGSIGSVFWFLIEL